jgi:NitT/TauT family transport system ATP-binding protein
MDFVSINNVSYAYKATLPVVSDINWNIQRGQFHSLVGRSGCGKTTLLKIVAGLLNPTAGDVFIASSSVKRPSFKTGFVFQAPTLLEWLSVLENVLLPLSIQKTEKMLQTACGLAVLKTVGMKDYADRYPSELSGGQQSRVAIARALITDPLLLLMDEPFAALDAMTREELQIDLLELCAERETTVLFVTHDISEAVYLSDKVAVMADGLIHNEFIIDIEKPRKHNTRYQPKFNSLCLDIRNSMKTPSPPTVIRGGL